MRILTLLSKTRTLLIIWGSILVAVILGSAKYLYITRASEVFEPIKFVLSLGEKSLFVLFPLLAISILLCILRYLDGKKIHQLEMHIIGISAILSSVSASGLIYLEARNYPNFLYSKYGLKLPLLKYTLISGLILSVLYISEIYLAKSRKRRFIHAAFVYILGKLGWINIILIVVGFSILGRLLAPSFYQLPGYFSYSLQTYDRRFEHFEYIEALSQGTPKDARIVLPPQSGTWPALSNPPIVRYFLFPRILISANVLDQQTFNKTGRVYFVEVNEALGDGHWPEIALSDKNVTLGNNRILTFSQIKTVSVSNNIKVYYIEP